MATWNYIFFDEDSETVHCLICECSMPSSRHSQQHVEGRRHAKAVDNYGTFITYHEGSDYYCDLCECWISSRMNVLQHLKGKRHRDAFGESDFEEEEEEDEGLDPYDFIITVNDDEFYCFLCNRELCFDAQLRYHAGSYDHNRAVEKYGHDITEIEGGWMECELCDCKITSYKCVYQHIIGRRHENALAESSD